MYLYVKWNRFMARFLCLLLPPLEHGLCFAGHSRHGGLRRCRRRV
jgi:hypothetical protein